MRQEMRTMSVPPDRDIYIINEVITAPKNDQPVDLRVRSVIQRENASNNFEQDISDKSGKNLILASLLTRALPSSQIKYNVSAHTYFPKVEHNVHNSNGALPLKGVYLHETPEYHDIPQHFQDNKRSILDKLNIKRGFSEKILRHKPWNVPISHEQNIRNTSSNYNLYDSLNDSSSSFRNIPKDIDIKVEHQYRLKMQLKNQEIKILDSCSVIRERLTSNTVIQPSQSSWKYPGYCPTGHLYRLLKQGSSENSTSSLKRKLTHPVDMTQNDGSKNKTLRCLLSSGKRLPPSNINNLQVPSLQQEKPRDFRTIKTKIKTEPFFDDKDEVQILYQESTHARYRQEVDMSSHIVYCPQVIRTVPGNVLKSLLVSNNKLTTQRPSSITPTARSNSILTIPRPATVLGAPRSSSVLPASKSPTSRSLSTHAASGSPNILAAARSTNILPASGPPSSGSPGSESTSSGSTDSGVFSDNLTDDRRRVARVLSGRHVKTGTGASITTLRLLRQMLLDRKNKTDRKL
ncbi:uncharacterized protein TNIN_146781 [Trichonephila inaurata madagascariensis]|uniref:Uncharacterized protein n=1 Tax=Trichonephila inaurata madagascariensis TaxID=2747483 RepID=A0A8X6Y108_9ARAC|nr:uncharacterized protein TNIN_146781 [Trichonephila inaurata madagascariensis]